MNEYRAQMITALPQLRDALENACGVPVKTAFPRSVSDGILLTVQEITNVHDWAPVVDRLDYQVDVWAYDYDTAWKLVERVNGVFAHLGFTRSVCDRDPMQSDSGGYLRYILRFSARIDKRTMRTIQS